METEEVEKKEKEKKERAEQEKKEVRTKPQNLPEQLTLEEAQGGAGKRIMENEINDPRYPKNEWEKKQHTHTTVDDVEIEIHYWEHIPSQDKHGFKFKQP